MKEILQNYPTKGSLSIAITGDFCPRATVEKDFSQGKISEESLFGNIHGIFQQNDITIVNLECPLTSETSSIPKVGSCLKSHPDTIRLLKYLNVTHVTLANNHIRDFGSKGLKDTLNVCKKWNIKTIGAGVTFEETRKIFYQNVKGKTIAVINMAENEFSYATANRGGANPFDLISLLQDIDNAKRSAEHVILILHGGMEYINYPSPQSVRMLRFLAEQGLTAIIRHHSHFVQGYEIWKGVPIFYSLGNFFFPSDNKSRESWFEGIWVTLNIADNGKCTFELTPFEQCKTALGIQLLEEPEKEDFFEKLDSYSEALKKPEELKKIWNSIIKQQKFHYLSSFLFPHFFLFRAARKLKILHLLKFNKNKSLVFENFIRSESHREAVLDIFENEHK